jgi:hypothetical protein
MTEQAPPPYPVPEPTQPKTPRNTTFSWLVGAGAVLIILGSFLPWVTAVTIFGTISKSGLDGGGDGVITLILGLAFTGAVLTSVTRGVARSLRWSTAILGVIMVLVAIAELNYVKTRLASIAANPFLTTSVGAGVYVLMLGSVVVLLGALASFSKETVG